MRVIAQIEKLDLETGQPLDPKVIDQVEATGATYEEARDAVLIPEGWRLIAWIAPDHLDRAINS